MSSGALPDVITCDRTLAAVPMMIEAGKIQCLNDLMEQYAPSMLTDIEPEYLQYHKYVDGKNYYWTNYIYTPFVMSRPDYPKIDAVFQTSLIRTDVWEAIGKPDTTSPALYLEMLKLVQEQFPDIPTLYFGRFPLNGGLFMNTDSPSWSMLGEFGVHQYDVSADGKVTSSVRSARWVEAIKFINEIHRSGLLAAESFVDDGDTWNAKVNNGEVAVFHASIANHAYLPGVEYTPLPYFKDEGSKFVKSGAGWLATMVTSDAKDLQRIMDFFAYIASTEGRQLVSWGIEGRHWEWSKDNPEEPVKTALWDNMADPEDYTKKWGFWQHRALHDQYYCNSLFEKWTPERLAWYELYGDVMELDIFDGVRNPALDDSAEGVILAKLNEHAYVNYPQLLMANSEADFDKIYAEFIKKCDELGLPTLEEYWTKRWSQFN
jgi:putative aldouronate transport system substrate-binding protein